MHRDARLAENRHELAIAAQHGSLDVERLAVGVSQECQEVVFGAAAVQRGDDLQDANWPRHARRVNLLGEYRLHAWLFYCRPRLTEICDPGLDLRAIGRRR